MTALLEQGFGLRCPGEGRLLAALQQVGRYVFGSPLVEASGAVLAARAAESLRGIVAGVPSPVGEAVLLCLLCRLAVGVDQFVSALEVILRLPAAEQEGVRTAARHGDDAALVEALREAARLGPFPTMLFRYCEHDARLGAGTHYERTVPAGTTVACVLPLAGVDPGAVADPHAFRPGRPPETYLLLPSDGVCPIALLPEIAGATEIVIVQLLKILLAHPGAHLAPARAGFGASALQWMGAASPVHRLIVSFRA
jgi:hypothetical protein